MGYCGICCLRPRVKEETSVRKPRHSFKSVKPLQPLQHVSKLEVDSERHGDTQPQPGISAFGYNGK